MVKNGHMTTEKCSRNMSDSDESPDARTFMSAMMFWVFYPVYTWIMGIVSSVLNFFFGIIATIFVAIFAFVSGCITFVFSSMFMVVQRVVGLIPNAICDVIIKSFLIGVVTSVFVALIRSCDGNTTCEILMFHNFGDAYSESMKSIMSNGESNYECDDLYGDCY